MTAALLSGTSVPPSNGSRPHGQEPARTAGVRAQRVLVLGAGRSGRAAAELLQRQGCRVVVYDRSPAALELLPESVERICAPALPDLSGYDRIIQSPGIAVPTGTVVVPEVDLAAQALHAPLIGVTGSNGKSTTTELVSAMLCADGKRAFVGGNVGIPLCSLVDLPSDWVVVELSSFQLEHARQVRPRVAVLLNLAPDHLDRHGSLEAYGAAKARLADLLADGGTLVFNEEDPWSAAIGARAAAEGRVRTIAFACREAVHAFAVFTRGDRIVFREAGRDVESLPVAELSAACRSPIANALASAAVARGAGASLAGIRRALASFQGLPHRNALVCERRGVRYVDDSKATNPAAAAASLGVVEGPLWWLAGGRNKGLDFAPLVGAARDVRAALLYGESAADLERALAGHMPTVRVANVAEAIAYAAAHAQPGDTVLLAPACASFDQFKSFEERGDHFAALARALPC